MKSYYTSSTDPTFAVTVVFSGVSLMAILQGIASSESVKVRHSPR